MRARTIAVVISTAWWALAGMLSGEEYWNQFRGPHGDGQVPSTALPLKWQETEHVTWKTAIHGKAWSSPVVWGQQIWMTSATEMVSEFRVS